MPRRKIDQTLKRTCIYLVVRVSISYSCFSQGYQQLPRDSPLTYQRVFLECGTRSANTNTDMALSELVAAATQPTFSSEHLVLFSYAEILRKVRARTDDRRSYLAVRDSARMLSMLKKDKHHSQRRRSPDGGKLRRLGKVGERRQVLVSLLTTRTVHH